MHFFSIGFFCTLQASLEHDSDYLWLGKDSPDTQEYFLIDGIRIPSTMVPLLEHTLMHAVVHSCVRKHCCEISAASWLI